MSKRANQSPDQPDPVNAGVGGDLKTPYQEYPAGEAQYDDYAHRDGIMSQFPPVVPVKRG